MKTRNLFLFAAAVLSLVACNGTQEPVGPTPVPPTPFTPSVSISGSELKNNSIDVNSNVHSIDLSVVANESWTLESDADWVSVSPASAVITDEKETTTPVALRIEENADAERTATLTLKAKDVKDIVITVKQEKHAFNPDVVVSGADIHEGQIEVVSEGGTFVISVDANVSWTLASNQDWASVAPTSGNITDEKFKTTEVALTVAENKGDERTATLTFKAENVADKVVTVKQAKHVFNPVVEISGEVIASGKIAAGCEGGAFTLKVVANESWTLESNQEWAKLDPASETITDEQSKETAVTLTLDPNTGDARNAKIVLKAEGVEDKTIVVEQAKNDAYLDVLDEDTNPIRSYEASGAGGTVAILVESSSKPEITVDVDWLKLTASTDFIPDEYWNLNLIVSVNTGSQPREGKVTFSVPGAEDVVLTVTQGVPETITLEAYEVSYKSASILITPSDETIPYYFNLLTKDYYDDLLAQIAEYEELTPDVIPYFIANSLAEANEISLEKFLSYVLQSGRDYINLADFWGEDLAPETEYVFFAQFMDGTGTALSPMATVSFKTEPVPEAEADYLAMIGTYDFNFNGYEYSEVSEKCEPTGKSGKWTAVIAPDVINRSLKIYFPVKGDGVSPIDDSDPTDVALDKFPLDYGTVEMEGGEKVPAIGWQFGSYSDMKGAWTFTSGSGKQQKKYPNCSMLWLPMDPETLHYLTDETGQYFAYMIMISDGGSLEVVSPEGTFVMATFIKDGNGSLLGRYGDFAQLTGMTKVSGEIPSKASVSSIKKNTNTKAGLIPLESYKRAKAVKAAKLSESKKAPFVRNFKMGMRKMPVNYVEIAR